MIKNKTNIIEALENKQVMIYDMSGRIIESIAKAGASQKIFLQKEGIYILKSDDYNPKIAVK
jgi:hypothetical protein